MSVWENKNFGFGGFRIFQQIKINLSLWAEIT
jgi:hypothetical protein